MPVESQNKFDKSKQDLEKPKIEVIKNKENLLTYDPQLNKLKSISKVVQSEIENGNNRYEKSKQFVFGVDKDKRTQRGDITIKNIPNYNKSEREFISEGKNYKVIQIFSGLKGYEVGSYKNATNIEIDQNGYKTLGLSFDKPEEAIKVANFINFMKNEIKKNNGMIGSINLKIIPNDLIQYGNGQTINIIKNTQSLSEEKNEDILRQAIIKELYDYSKENNLLLEKK